MSIRSIGPPGWPIEESDLVSTGLTLEDAAHGCLVAHSGMRSLQGLLDPDSDFEIETFHRSFVMLSLFVSQHGVTQARNIVGLSLLVSESTRT